MNEILQKVHEGDYSFLDHFSLESLDDFQTEEVRKILQSSMKLVELSLDSKSEKLQGLGLDHIMTLETMEPWKERVAALLEEGDFIFEKCASFKSNILRQESSCFNGQSKQVFRVLELAFQSSNSFIFKRRIGDPSI